MTRDISASFITALEDDIIYPALLVDIELESSTVYIWTGFGDYVYNSNTYVGVGNLGGISDLVETGNVEANGITLTLAGIPTALISAALVDARQGKTVSCHLALFDSTETLIDVADNIFQGLLDVPTLIKGSPTSTISITAESRLIELTRSRERRYTDEDQQELFSGDLGLEYVVGLQDKEIKWGTA